jgi:thiamine pyrophosphate-dependent acetolactate synthase large subunit-like protein
MVIIIMNDSGYGAEFHKLKLKGHDSTLATWKSPDFVSIAKAIEGRGKRLAREIEMGKAIQEGLDHAGLFVIDARISSTTASDYYRQIHFGEPNQVPLVRRVKSADTEKSLGRGVDVKTVAVVYLQ